GGKTDFQRKLSSLFVEYQARQKIAVRILLPVDEVIFRLNAKRITRHRRAAVRSRTQPNDLRRQADQPVVLVDSLVMQRYSNAHSGLVEKVGLTGSIPLLERRGGCAIKKCREATKAAQTEW